MCITDVSAGIKSRSVFVLQLCLVSVLLLSSLSQTPWSLRWSAPRPRQTDRVTHWRLCWTFYVQTHFFISFSFPEFITASPHGWLGLRFPSATVSSTVKVRDVWLHTWCAPSELLWCFQVFDTVHAFSSSKTILLSSVISVYFGIMMNRQ